MDPSPGALLAIAILGFFPGFLVYRAIRPAGSALESAAVAPALSFGFVFVLGEIATLASSPFAPVPFVVAVALTAVSAAVRWWREPEPRGRREPAPRSRPAAALVAGGILLAAAGWVVGIRGFATTPPYIDSANHGLMAAQVAAHESLDPGVVLGSDAGSVAAPGETAYYPLAIHGQVALAHRIFGVSIADGLLATTFLFSVFVLPLGLFVAVRGLVPDQPVLAGVTALLGATTGFFPVLPMSFGGLPLVIGTSMVPAVAVVAGRYLNGRGSLRDAAVGGLGAIGVLATHTSEAPLLGLFLAPVLAEAVLRRRLRPSDALRRAAIFGAWCAILAAPTLPRVAGGAAERSAIDEGHAASLGKAFGAFRAVVGTGAADVLGLLALVGVGLCLVRRRHLPLVATTGAVLGLYVVATAVRGPLRAVTVPWYQHPGRIALNLVLLIPFFAALALVEFGPVLWARRRERAGGFVPVVGLAAALAVAGFSASADDLRSLFRERSIVDTDARAAFAYLKTAVNPGERVLNDAITDGGVWMYPFAGVVPLLGLQPAKLTDSWNERVWLVENLPSLGRDPRVEQALRKYNVRFVYFDDRTFTDNPHHVDGAALGATPGLCPRFSQGTVRVYEVVSPPDCSTPL
ncbi:MAG TPA: DUF6541 family protein [Acidimicrobiia bacterium]|nr:DUF6541 family protein [Acidimicrobiia bacterium]